MAIYASTLVPLEETQFTVIYVPANAPITALLVITNYEERPSAPENSTDESIKNIHRK